MNEHTCIKCGTKYFDNDEDDFYCKECDEKKKQIAREVDMKLAGRVSRIKQKSDLQVFDEIARARGTRFVNIKDLGIQL